MRRSTKHELYWLLGMFILFFLISIFIRPVGDDWETGPLRHFQWTILLPNDRFWRPFEEIYRVLIGHAPWVYPWLNHLLVASAHVLTAYCLYHLCDYFKINKPIKIGVILYFLFSPFAMGTVMTVDAWTQAFAELWGILSVLVYFRNTGIKRYLLWIICCIMAVFTKESGIVWFIVTPLLFFVLKIDTFSSIFKKENVSKIAFPIIVGAAFAVMYFILRELLLPSGTNIGVDNPNSRYHVSILSVRLFRNLCMIIGGCFTSFDSVALFYHPRNWLLAGITIILNIPFLILTGYLFVKAFSDKQKIGKILILIIILLIVSSPHLIVQVGEMHVYPSLVISAIILGMLYSGIEYSPKTYMVLTAFVISAFISNIHKWIGAYTGGQTGYEIALDIKEKTTVEPNKVLLICVRYDEQQYSSFGIPAYAAFNLGNSAEALYKYQYPKLFKKFIIKDGDESFIEKQVNNIIQSETEKYDCIWIVNRTNVKVINNE